MRKGFVDFGALDGICEGSYEDILEHSEPDYIVVLGAPEDEMSGRVQYAVSHYQNLQRFTGENFPFLAPEMEAEVIEKELADRFLEAEVNSTTGVENRWQEAEEIRDFLDGKQVEELHVFTSDYAKGRDRYIIQKQLDVESEYFAFPTASSKVVGIEIGSRWESFTRRQATRFEHYTGFRF